MKIIFITTVISLTVAASLFADDTTNVLGDEKSRLSYAVGMWFAARLKAQGADVDNDLVSRGLTDEQDGRPTLMSVQEAHDIVNKFQLALADKQQQMLNKNKSDGLMFLAQNKNQPGVNILPAVAIDGKTYDLQYKVITDGAGEIPTPADSVTVNYRGSFINGTEFDSSAKRGQPGQFHVNGVIHGLSAALTHMKVGSKWQLFIPSELAYGQAGIGSMIEPNTALIFEVELLSVQHPQPPPPPAIPQQLTSDIIKVPSKAEMDKGAKVEVLNPDDVRKLQQSEAQQAK